MYRRRYKRYCNHQNKTEEAQQTQPILYRPKKLEILDQERAQEKIEPLYVQKVFDKPKFETFQMSQSETFIPEKRFKNLEKFEGFNVFRPGQKPKQSQITQSQQMKKSFQKSSQGQQKKIKNFESKVSGQRLFNSNDSVTYIQKKQNTKQAQYEQWQSFSSERSFTKRDKKQQNNKRQQARMQTSFKTDPNRGSQRNLQQNFIMNPQVPYFNCFPQSFQAPTLVPLDPRLPILLPIDPIYQYVNYNSGLNSEQLSVRPQISQTSIIDQLGGSSFKQSLETASSSQSIHYRQKKLSKQAPIFEIFQEKTVQLDKSENITKVESQ